MNGEDRFETSDVWQIVGILILGGMGYLCDLHSPFVRPFLWLFGLAFTLLLLTLLGIVFRDSVLGRKSGGRAGTLRLAVPFVCWIGYQVWAVLSL